MKIYDVNMIRDAHKGSWHYRNEKVLLLSDVEKWISMMLVEYDVSDKEEKLFVTSYKESLVFRLKELQNLLDKKVKG